jgi:hypothetical protein
MSHIAANGRDGCIIITVFETRENISAANTQPVSHPGLARTLWLLPIVFVIHDTEELLTMPGWLAHHRPELERLAGVNQTMAHIVHSLATTTPQVAVAIGCILLVFLAVTAGASLRPRRGPWLYAYACLLGVLFLHVFAHIAGAILVRGYTPGVIGAVLVIIPGSIFIYKRLFEARLLTLKSAVLTALIGLSLLVPGVLLAHRIGRMIGGS